MKVLELKKITASKYPSCSVRMPNTFYQTRGSWIPSLLFLLRLSHSVTIIDHKMRRSTLLESAFTNGIIQSFLSGLLEDIQQAVTLLVEDSENRFLQIAVSNLMQFSVINLTCNNSQTVQGEQDNESVILRQLRNENLKEYLNSISKLSIQSKCIPVMISCAALLKTFKRKETFDYFFSPNELIQNPNVIGSNWTDSITHQFSNLLYFSFSTEKISPERKINFDKNLIPLLM